MRRLVQLLAAQYRLLAQHSVMLVAKLQTCEPCRKIVQLIWPNKLLALILKKWSTHCVMRRPAFRQTALLCRLMRASRVRRGRNNFGTVAREQRICGGDDEQRQQCAERHAA